MTEEALFHAVLAQPPADRGAYLAAALSRPGNVPPGQGITRRQ